MSEHTRGSDDATQTDAAEHADQMTSEEKRHDQLTAAPDATEADAAPRIEVTEHDGNTRIDIRPDAAVRPGPGPGVDTGAHDSER
ncbi:multidrug transporter [uncultured Microbacterium sp.]|uniref:multidrug transporter n=1 Tax=uncultured Microbacterium sp. TaxID=191216 RepID=UPI0028D22105|nr:multidrug transporter [uncultured Microbacterium sp.]